MTGRPPLPPELEAAVARVLAVADLSLPARREVEEELRAHFEDGLAAGIGPAELLRRFGDPAEAGRRIGRSRSRGRGTEGDANGRRRMGWSELGTEMRRAVRRLVRTPGFSLVMVATLALGIGANTAVFTVLDAVLLAPLPYEEPAELVRVYATDLDDGSTNYLQGLGIPEYRQWDQVFGSFGSLYTYRETGGDLSGGDTTERVIVSQVDGGLFEALGVSPLLGRTFDYEASLVPGEGEARRSGVRVAVISHELWTRRWAADPSIVGRTVRLDGAPYEIVGVMPRGFTNPFGSPPDLWVPHDLLPGGWNSWGNFYLSGVARLRDGVSVEEARSRLDVLAASLREREPDMGDWGVTVEPLRTDVVGEGRRSMLWLLAGAVGLVLLSACVNAGNLAFARTLGRGRDLAVRGALGSGRARLIVHLLMESALLAVAGGLLGLALGWAGVRGLLLLAPEALPPLMTPHLSGRVLLIATAATGTALALFGLAPALRLSSTAPAETLRGGRGGTEARGLRRLRAGLVVTQVSVALVLVVGAGLLTRSFARLTAVDLGVEAEDVLTFEVHLPDATYPSGDLRHAFHARLHDRLSALPGVESVGATSWLPVNGRYHSWGFYRAEEGFGPESDWYSTDVRIVAGDYFETMGMAIVRGRGMEALDPEGPPVVWVNERLVADIFGDEDPVGRVIGVGNEERRIVGVVETVANGPRGETFRETYIPHAHYAADRNWALIQVVRARGDLSVLREAIRDELAQADPGLVLYRPRPFAGVLAGARAESRFATALMGTFALLALALSGIGTYGVLSNTVARRRREIGIRMALGADAGQVGVMVVGSAAGMIVLGAVLGAVGAWAGSRWLESLLFGVERADPIVWSGGLVLLLGVGSMAAWIPARRAARVDPARTLGAE